MPRGPKPTPTVLKLLRGKPGHHPINLDEPMPGALEQDVPRELEPDAEAAAEWTRAIVPAIAIGQITAADRTLAIAHCVLWSTWRSQIAAAAAGTMTIKAGRTGYEIPNPARVMANKTLTLLAGIDEKLGFTPTSRGRIQVKGPG